MRQQVCKGASKLEGAHARTRIAVVLDGMFLARSSQGSALLHPGAFLLGNAGGAFSYRYLDEAGTRAVVFEYDGEIADRRFDRPSLPSQAGTAPLVALIEEAVADGQPMALEEAALLVLERAVTGGRVGERAVGRGLEGRVARAIRYIDAHFDEDCGLDRLADEARLSKFHLVRSFSALTGQTPRQLVIARRLRAAARALRAKAAPIPEIAASVGFGDLSHFNASFVRAFGLTPSVYRARAARQTGA